MKITAIKSFVCNARMRNWIFVKVETDQPGLSAGARRRSSGTRDRSSARSRISRTLLIGEDPGRIEHLWQMMFRQHFWHGTGIVRSDGDVAASTSPCGTSPARCSACRATACGAARCATTSACTAIWAAAGWRTSTKPRSANADRFAELARAGRGERIHGVQVDGGASDRCRSRAWRPCCAAEQAVARHARGRRPNIDIMVDCHARPSPRDGDAVREGAGTLSAVLPRGAVLARERRVAGHINAAVSTPIATGERLTNLSQFRELFAARGCEIVQPDITHCGGLSAARKIAAMAEAHRIGLAPHNPRGR